jgi:tetratricopeptide (TPR) repeat protein
MAGPGAAPNRNDAWVAAAISAALALSVLALYAQTRRFEFVTLDDYFSLVYRPMVSKGLTWEGVWWALSSVEADWHPVTWLSHMLDFSLFGPNAGPQHLVNAGLHAANGVLLFLALRSLSGALWSSALVAALFALHPLRVESVAWMTERKDVLSGLFWMLTLLAYARFVRRPSVARYALVAAAFALGLMSKPMLVSLPFVLLLLDVWPLRRLRRGGSGPSVARLLLEKLPLVILAAAAAGVTVLAAYVVGGVRSLDQMSRAWRLVNPPIACCTYLYQTLWPTRLAVIYPHPALIPGTRVGDYLWPAVGAAALLATVTALCIASARRRPYLLVGWLWYLVTLVPVLGIFQVGHQSHADRFTYLPMIGVYLMITWGVRDACARWPGLRLPAVGGAALVLLALAASSWRQIGTWQNSRRLFEHAIAVTDDNYFAHQALGAALRASGELQPARPHLEEALRIKPDSAYALEQLGLLFDQQGDLDGAAEAYEKAVRLSGKTFDARRNLATIRRAQGRRGDEIALLTEAVRYAPEDAQLHFELGTALLQEQRFAEAATALGRAVELAPDSADAHSNLAVALGQQGQLAAAATHFGRALALNPNHAMAARGLEWVRAQQQAQAERR